MQNGYFISITPDVVYEEEIRALVATYPLSQMMVETDGPWQFSGIFNNQRTEPKMNHRTIQEIAHIKQMNCHDVYNQILYNTQRFYQLYTDRYTVFTFPFVKNQVWRGRKTIKGKSK